MKSIFHSAIATILFSIVLNASATTRYVDVNSTNPVAPFTDWSTAATEIQPAVNAAVNGDLVLVTNGVYETGGRLFGSSSNRVAIDSKTLTIQSVNGPAVTVIKGYQVPGTATGAGAVRCVYLMTSSRLSGFTLTNGASDAQGFGGGVACESTNAVITNCVLIANAAGATGGGVLLGTLINCTLVGNRLTSIGSFGGGASGSVLINCLVIRNQSTYIAGGAYSSTLINCTVVSNTAGASDYGGGFNGGTVKNSIVYYNSPDNGVGNLTNCCLIPIPAGSVNCISNAPHFTDLAGGDFHLQAGSPGMDAGNNAFNAYGTDLEFHPRVVGGAIDLGAYEFHTPIRFVNVSNPTPASPYTSWAIAATNIQVAIDVADPGDLILVNDGLYQAGARVVAGSMSNRVAADKAVTIQSVNGPAATTIKGKTAQDFSVRCAYLAGGAALIGFTLSDGSTRSTGDITNDQSGGGVWCASPGAVISNCVFVRNFANQKGGAVFSGTLNHCALSNNAAFIQGGGAFAANLNDCLVHSNRVVQGFGGGGASFGILNHCVISSNSAFQGGGASSNVLNNCVLKFNSASSGGGAYRSKLNNCTMVSNNAGTGGGITEGMATNSILYYNTPANIFNTKLIAHCCTVPGDSEFQNITNAPAFLNLAGGDLHLQSNSPCINAGHNAEAPAGPDLDGNPRIVGGTVDIGAYEFQSPGSTLSYAFAQQFGLPTDGSADYSDSDGDGLNNWQEWRAGTDPTNALSVLQLTAPVPAPSGVAVTWQSVSGVRYFLERSAGLGTAFSIIQSNIVSHASATTFTDTNATGGGPFFYRVGVQ
jgi:hypothetical protein